MKDSNQYFYCPICMVDRIYGIKCVSCNKSICEICGKLYIHVTEEKKGYKYTLSVM